MLYCVRDKEGFVLGGWGGGDGWLHCSVHHKRPMLSLKLQRSDVWQRVFSRTVWWMSAAIHSLSRSGWCCPDICFCSSFNICTLTYIDVYINIYTFFFFSFVFVPWVSPLDPHFSPSGSAASLFPPRVSNLSGQRSLWQMCLSGGCITSSSRRRAWEKREVQKQQKYLILAFVIEIQTGAVASGLRGGKNIWSAYWMTVIADGVKVARGKVSQAANKQGGLESDVSDHKFF